MDTDKEIDILRNEHRRPGHGAVAVIVRDARFLVIRRSATVRAPNKLCFAGGTIEAGESPEQAIARELKEELNVAGRVGQHIWTSRTAWGTQLEWLVVDLTEEAVPEADPLEVAEWMWLTAEELLGHADLLPSVPDFFAAWAMDEFELPPDAGTPKLAWCELGR